MHLRSQGAWTLADDEDEDNAQCLSFKLSSSWHMNLLRSKKRSSWHGAQMMMMMMLRLWRWVVLIGAFESLRLSLSRPGGLEESRSVWGGASDPDCAVGIKSKKKKKRKTESLVVRHTTWRCCQSLIWAILPKPSPKWECFRCLISLITSSPSSTSSMNQVSASLHFSVCAARERLFVDKYDYLHSLAAASTVHAPHSPELLSAINKHRYNISKLTYCWYGSLK